VVKDIEWVWPSWLYNIVKNMFMDFQL
jgi:hypothetical protein